MFLYDTPPCKNCKKRFQFCHTTCEDYKIWKADHEKRRAEAVERFKMDNEFIAAKVQFCDNYYRKTKGKRK